MERKTGKQGTRLRKGASLPDTSPDLESFKKMVRLLERKHREFLEQDWKEHAYEIQRSQFNQLMTVRFAMPCNLGRIMAVTGLTSAGASLFVDKLVQSGYLLRTDDPNDRRNVRISLSDKGAKFIDEVVDRFNEFIDGYLRTRTKEELAVITRAMNIINATLDDGEENGSSF